MMTCLFCDAIARIKNAKMSDSLVVKGLLWSKKVFSILKVLEAQEIIKSVEMREMEVGRCLDLELRPGGFREIHVESTPGIVRHVRSKEIPKYKNGYGKVIISTSQGVMTGEEARNRGIGGKVLLKVI